MKKYWKLIIVTAIICLTFLVFMYEGKVGFWKMPAYTLQTVQGDQALGKNVIAQGYITHRSQEGEFSDIQVTEKGDKKYRSLPFYKRIDGEFLPKDFEELRKDYKQYMRAKNTYDTYDESDQFIAFVSPKYNLGVYDYTSLTFDVMDKNAKKRSTFDLNFGKALDVIDLTVEDIQLMDDHAYVFISNYDYEIVAEDGQEEVMNESQNYQLVTVDLAKQEIINTQLLTDLKNEEMWNNSYELFTLVEMHGDNRAVTGIFEEIYDEDGNSFAREANMIYFDLFDGEKQENLDVEFPNLAERPVAFIDGSLVFVYEEEDGVTIEYVDVETGETNLSESFADINLYDLSVQVTDEQVMYFTGTEDAEMTYRKVFAFTTDTLELVYEGEVTAKSNDEEYELYINDIEFQ